MEQEYAGRCAGGFRTTRYEGGIATAEGRLEP